jgi:hypothetical protein
VPDRVVSSRGGARIAVSPLQRARLVVALGALNLALVAAALAVSGLNG